MTKQVYHLDVYSLSELKEQLIKKRFQNYFQVRMCQS